MRNFFKYGSFYNKKENFVKEMSFSKLAGSSK